MSPDILESIVEGKRKRLAEERQPDLSEILKEIHSLPPPRDFYEALAGPAGMTLIAEMKKGSPSQGLFMDQYDPPSLARDYTGGGAHALSVLTEEQFFFGSPSHLREVRRVTPLPLLRKDFLLEEWEVARSRILGADAVLLIVAILDPEKLGRMVQTAFQAGVEPLVEVHSREEVRVALQTPARIIGVNNRDLKTFRVSLETTKALAPLILGEEDQRTRIVVSESGIATPEQVRDLRNAGVKGILVGEALLLSPRGKQKIRELIT